MVDGAFAPLHPGHLAHFMAARALGRPLLCNLCPDEETVKKHPILLPAHERAEVIAALDVVTYVHVSDRPAADVLKALQPRYYVKGADWRDRLPQDHLDACAEGGTEVVYTDAPAQSSTAYLARLQPDVDAFERFVLGQQPANTPWRPTAAVPYDFESRKRAEGRHPELIRDVLCAPNTLAHHARPELVLDYGCGPGHLVRLLRDIGVCAYGFEPYNQIDAAVERWGCSQSQVDAMASRGNFRVVVCREVLEHCTVREIQALVRRLCTLSSRLCYVTTRFTRARHFLDFTDHDDLDPTHITIMSKEWLRHLFVLEGFRRRADLESRLDHLKKGRCLVYERA